MLNRTQKTLKTIKRLLLRQQKEIEKNLKEVEKDDPVKDDIPESTEPGTASWIAEAHSRTIAIGGELKTVAINIKKALQNIRKGTYGKCERCGGVIEEARLKAIPTTTFCLSCSKKLKK